MRFGGGGTIHFFLLTLYNFKNIGRARAPPAPLLRGPCYYDNSHCTVRLQSLLLSCKFFQKTFLENIEANYFEIRTRIFEKGAAKKQLCPKKP